MVHFVQRGSLKYRIPKQINHKWVLTFRILISALLHLKNPQSICGVSFRRVFSCWTTGTGCFFLKCWNLAYSAKIEDMRVSQLRVESLTTSRSASECIKFHISHLISTLKKPRRFSLFVFWDSSGSLNSTHVAFLVTEDGGCCWWSFHIKASVRCYVERSE